MQPTEPRVAVASEHPLIAETVRVAVASHGLDAFVTPWPHPRWGVEGAVEPPEVVLLVCDLDDPEQLELSRVAVRPGPPSWLVISGIGPGPGWGAVVEAGAELVLPTSTGVEEVVDAVRALARGEAPLDERRRRELRDLWRADRSLLATAKERMRTLSPRETTVLEGLYAGQPVHVIAQRCGVSTSTVRSQVKAILRKLDVQSQLAAVALLDHLRDEQVGGVRPGGNPTTPRMPTSGADSDVPGTSRWDHTTIECEHAYELATWWKEVLAYVDAEDAPNEPGDDECVIRDPSSGLRLRFLEVPPGSPLRNRIHLDLRTGAGTHLELDRLLALGATRVAELPGTGRTATGWVVLADPEGNEFRLERSDAGSD